MNGHARSTAELGVVIAHDFAETFGGAERISAAIAATFPHAEFWSLYGRREVAARMGVADRFHSILPDGRTVRQRYRSLAPVYPAIVKLRTLPAADVLVTSSYAYVHGFRTRNDAPQVCYCLSPLRFAWSMTAQYSGRWAPGPARAAAFRAFARLMRATDRRAAAKVTRYLAESHFVADQLREFYGRKAEVLWPPVDTNVFTPGEAGHDGYFLYCSRLIEPYKRPTMVVEAFRSLPDRRLVIAADGPELGRLKRIAPSNVEFVGPLHDRELVKAMQRCAALIFPSRDDFGLVPVEVMACGRPVIAYAGGGALETIVAGRSGEFLDRQEVTPLVDLVREFDPDAYDPGEIRRHAEQWSVERFQQRLEKVVLEVARTGC